jgi:hypothetical protein
MDVKNIRYFKISPSLSLNFSVSSDPSPYHWRLFCIKVWCGCSGPPRRRKYNHLCQSQDQCDSRRRCAHGVSILLVHDRGPSLVPRWNAQLLGVYAVCEQSRRVFWTTGSCPWTARTTWSTRRCSWTSRSSRCSWPAPTWNGHEPTTRPTWNGYESTTRRAGTARLRTSSAKRGA